MKKMIKLVTIVVILIILLATNVKAYTVNPGAIATIVSEQELPYHYATEEKGVYKRLMYKVGTTLYYLKRNEDSFMSCFTNAEKYEDTILERILENGYPAKSTQELGVSEEKAYFATQEAIFAYLEDKEISKYIAENEEGQKIIDCVANILREAKKEEVTFTQVDTQWQVDETDVNRRYKQYRISLSPKIESVSIALQNAIDIQICNNQNEPITTARNGDIVKIIVPKGMNQTFQVKLVYTKQGASVYQIYNTSDTNLQYLLSVDENLTKEKTFEVDFKNLAPVTITNLTYETQAPMSESEFTIFDSSHKAVRENLVTDENGEIHTFLEKGEYLLSQTKVKDGYSPSGDVLNFEIEKLEEVKLTILNIKETKEEIEQEQIKTNVVQENKKIVENNVKYITNIHQTNIEKEVLEETNETNFENINHFVNTTYQKNIHNITRENIYQNNSWKETVTNSILPGKNQMTNLSREAYYTYLNDLKTAAIEVPILPVALRQ